jgi:hypothetical protein
VRSLEELVVPEAESAWPEIAAVIASAPYPVEVLEADPTEAARCLHQLQVTTRSWLGAVVHRTGGVVVDYGWLRIFGAGHRGRMLADILTVNAGDVVGVIVAEDVLGGRFSWGSSGSEVQPTIHYFGPDTLEWQDLDIGYGHWLGAMIGGATTQFYENLRWPGWAAEVGTLRLDQGISAYPPPSTVEGMDLGAARRGVVPMAELVDYYGS